MDSMKIEKRSFLKGGGRLSFAVAALIVVTLCSFTVKAEKYYWTAAEGNFNDSTKWHKTTYNGATGEVPGPSDEVTLYGTNCTISVDDEIEVGTLWTNYGATGKTNVYTLVGNGKLPDFIGSVYQFVLMNRPFIGFKKIAFVHDLV